MTTTQPNKAYVPVGISVQYKVDFKNYIVPRGMTITSMEKAVRFAELEMQATDYFNALEETACSINERQDFATHLANLSPSAKHALGSALVNWAESEWDAAAFSTEDSAE